MAEPHTSPTSGAHGDIHLHPEAVPVFVYLRVFAALMGLLGVTVLAAAVDLGPWNLPIALSIGVMKAALIFAYFMHLRFSTRLVQVTSVLAFLWLGILFVLTASDYLTRD